MAAGHQGLPIEQSPRFSVRPGRYASIPYDERRRGVCHAVRDRRAGSRPGALWWAACVRRGAQVSAADPQPPRTRDMAGRPREGDRAGARLGPFLCWAVVFADIGTSVYYTPGILFHQVGTRAALFVGMTLVVFVLLAVKYAEVTWRYP